MTKIITLKLHSGSLKMGFNVSLEIAEEGKPVYLQKSGDLPANNQLYDEIRLLEMALNSAPHRTRLETTKNQVKNVSEPDNCAKATQRVIQLFNQWLTYPTFSSVRDELLTAIAKTRKSIRLLIATDDIVTQRLPWHDWKISTDNSHLEIGFCGHSYKQIQPAIKFNKKVKILAIIGDDSGINPADDLKVLAKYGAAITPLINSTKSEVIAHIGKPEGWDILFFAGHSHTEESRGVLKINDSEYLTIDDVKNSLKTAIFKGLQLAIFNSCDGIGLARDLANLNIPQSIFMRQPIPDLVATIFLEYFLTDYTGGNSLYLSVRNAREKLEEFQADFPGVTSFPVIYQNPAVIPPTWQQLRWGRGKLHQVMLAIGVILGILLMRYLGLFAGLELRAYDHFMLISPPESQDDRLLIITVDEPDIQYQNQQGMTRKGSLSDAAFSQIIAKILPHQPRVIGSDIYHDFPVDRHYPEVASFFKNHPNFFAICQDSDRDNNHLGIAPPPEVAHTRLGFSNVLVDTDGIIRRHLWYMNPSHDTPCPTNKSFALQVALSYLEAEGIQPEVTPQGYLKLGGVYLTALERNLGGYHQLDTRGYQMLLNYRSGAIADTISLTQLLTESIDPNLVSDRIILIGNIAPSYKDFHRTPITPSFQIHHQTAGVFIQAQMVSQIISAVQDNRPLIQPIPRSLEIISILAWSSLGGVVGWRVPGGMRFYFTVGGIIVIIYSICFVSFLAGYWIPLIPSGLGFALTAIILTNRDSATWKHNHHILTAREWAFFALPPPPLTVFMIFLNRIFVGIFALPLALNTSDLQLSDSRETQPYRAFPDSEYIREPLNFRLPDRGRPGDRTSQAGGRGNCTKDTQITALVPSQNWGYTLSDRPSFWFYLTASKDSSWSAEFELQDHQKNRLVELSLTVNPGLIEVTLPEDIALETAETNYSWRFSLICEPSDRTGDLVVRGQVLKRELDQDLQAQIRDKFGRDLALVYAANSIWFDLLTLVMKFREEQPQNPLYKEDWQELLEAIGLSQ